jgi:hypothetical protein
VPAIFQVERFFPLHLGSFGSSTVRKLRDSGKPMVRQDAGENLFQIPNSGDNLQPETNIALMLKDL